MAVKNLVSWSVRFLVHGGLGSGAIETHNCAAAKEIRSKTIPNAARLFRRLQPVIPTDAQFRGSFLSCGVSKAFLARYYLRALEQQAAGVMEPELVPNDNAEVVNLEHVLPQKPSNQWTHVPIDEQSLLISRLGNLALLKTKINTRAGNDGFTFKKAFYAQSAYELTKCIALEIIWDKAAIDRRQERMADLAVATWPLK